MADMAPTSATEQTLSSWIAPTVTNYLGKATALSDLPFEAYKGPTSAGASDLQNKAFQGIANLTVPTATNFSTGTFDTSAAQKYMNPYLQMSLDPQLAELQRQNKIDQMNMASKLTGAGAFGGSRQAVLNAENSRNLMDKMNQVIGSGYNTSFTNAMNQFNTEQGRNLDVQKLNEDSKRYGSDYALKALSAELGAGQTQRDIEKEKIAADYGQYMREFNYPQESLDKLGAAIKNVPAYSTSASNTYGVVPSDFQNILGGAGGIIGLLNALKAGGTGTGSGSILDLLKAGGSSVSDWLNNLGTLTSDSAVTSAFDPSAIYSGTYDPSNSLTSWID